MIYTGIGSRRTPNEYLSIMTQLAKELSALGWTLRSGGADGADIAFELGATKKEIYLPFNKFNSANRVANGLGDGIVVKQPAILDRAKAIAEKVHPAWNVMTFAGKALHTRNVFQVLGATLTSPSDIVITYTDQGKWIGGTRTAMVLAAQQNVPIINLGEARWQNASVEGLMQVITDEKSRKTYLYPRGAS